ncbi:hypothetical protein Q3F63_06520 [Enterococcus faecium]|nr:hypothetical protein [Enterococcus faecium]MDK4443094.1 hypothetical protein [Enterococcus faecium]MDQ8548085.1 hypothetical protein [Enterococcus faecium]BDX40385.1 hypothetical protein K6D_04590 [Enterococcus faecium]
MIGHSKGGAEAAANAVATDTNAFLFNPATVNLSAYELNSSTYTADMIAYIVKGDALNNIFGGMSNPIGELIMLDRQHDSPWWRIISRIGNSVKNHGMEAIISALEDRYR